MTQVFLETATVSDAADSGGDLALTGPTPPFDRARLPLRGDLAHIRLAGICFVPHYAAPLRFCVSATGATLLAAAREGADVLTVVRNSTGFDVLDIAGDWAWGQLDDGLADPGLVGYLPLAALERP